MRNVKDRVITASELRANLAHVLDVVIATGRPCRVVRRGGAVVMTPQSRRTRRSSVKPPR